MSKTFAPTLSNERLTVVDVLRGFALVGILLVNMVSFADGTRTVFQPPAPTTPALDVAALWFVRFAAEGKFYVLFSFLFGLGFALQLSRAEAGFLRWYVRRLLILLVIGVIHAVLIWAGDILTWYAVLGFVLLLFRKTPTRRLWKWVIGLLILPQVLTLAVVIGFSIARSDPQLAAEFGDLSALLGDQVTLERAVYSGGSFAEITNQRIGEYLSALGLFFLRGPNILAMFLLGMIVGKRRLLHDLDQQAALYRRMVLIGLPVGLLFSAVDATLLLRSSRIDFNFVSFVASVSQSIGSLGLLAFFIGGFALLMRQPAWRVRLQPLASTGQMALTNYLMQSVICTTLFYSYGFRLFGQVSYAACVLLVLAIYSVQVVYSTLWMQRFRYGPMEWLWRSLSYGKFQSLSRQPVLSISGLSPSSPLPEDRGVI